jgi:hypothetical protein
MIAAKMGMGSATVPVAAFGVSPNATFRSLNPQLTQLSTFCPICAPPIGKAKQGKASDFDTPPRGAKEYSAKIARSITLSKPQTAGSKPLATTLKLEFIIQGHGKLPQKMPNLPPKNAQISRAKKPPKNDPFQIRSFLLREKTGAASGN